MNIEQQITWTVLPNGIDSKRNAHLSIFVSPRLKTDREPAPPGAETIRRFPRLAQTCWSGLAFACSMNSGWSLELKPDLSALDPDLWSELFPKDTFVRPYQFPDYSRARAAHLPGAQCGGLPEKHLPDDGRRHRRASCRGILTSTHPSQTLWAAFRADRPGAGAQAPTQRKEGRRADAARPLRRRDARPEGAGAGQAIRDLQQPDRAGFLPGQPLLQPPGGRYRGLHLEKPDPSLVPKPPEVPDLDFHQALSALGDQPAVLRALGIILDISLPVEKILDNGGGTLIWAEPLEGEQPFAPYNQHLTPAHRLPAG